MWEIFAFVVFLVAGIVLIVLGLTESRNRGLNWIGLGAATFLLSVSVALPNLVGNGRPLKADNLKTAGVVYCVQFKLG